MNRMSSKCLVRVRREEMAISVVKLLSNKRRNTIFEFAPMYAVRLDLKEQTI